MSKRVCDSSATAMTAASLPVGLGTRIFLRTRFSASRGLWFGRQHAVSAWVCRSDIAARFGPVAFHVAGFAVAPTSLGTRACKSSRRMSRQVLVLIIKHKGGGGSVSWGNHFERLGLGEQSRVNCTRSRRDSPGFALLAHGVIIHAWPGDSTQYVTVLWFGYDHLGYLVWLIGPYPSAMFARAFAFEIIKTAIKKNNMSNPLPIEGYVKKNASPSSINLLYHAVFHIHLFIRSSVQFVVHGVPAIELTLPSSM